MLCCIILKCNSVFKDQCRFLKWGLNQNCISNTRTWPTITLYFPCLGSAKGCTYSIYSSSRLIFLLTNTAGFASPFSAEGNEIFYPFTEQFWEEQWPWACPCTAPLRALGLTLGTGSDRAELIQPSFPDTAYEAAATVKVGNKLNFI